MSEYRHFIAYIYEYEDGKKKANAGFVKVHMRNGNCRIQLKIQGTGKKMSECLVYGFFHEDEWLYGILMGKIGMRGGNYEGNIVAPEKIFQDNGYSFTRLGGLWIQEENRGQESGRTFLTVWDERPADSRKLTTERPVAREKSEEDETEKMQETENVQELEAQDCQREELSNDSLQERWEQFQLHYPHVAPLTDGKITECIQITPKDITFLGEQEREFALCPFVRQKYMKYQQLLLGKHESGRYVLAVPGVNRGIQDQNLAAMYGFPEFQKAEDEELGYWYHFLN